jgi:hypothetical protein
MEDYKPASMRVRHLEIGTRTSDQGGKAIGSYKVPKHQVSMKSGPNGTGFFSFPYDRFSVQQNPVVKTKIKNYLETSFAGDTSEWLTDLLEPYEDLNVRGRKLSLGKVSLLHEGGKLKPRVFAIVDSVTQTILGPLHDDLMAILKNIPEDCTFNHSKVGEVATQL